jgi:hypothetical protein
MRGGLQPNFSDLTIYDATSTLIAYQNYHGGGGEQRTIDRAIYVDERLRFYFPTQLRVIIRSRE